MDLTSTLAAAKPHDSIRIPPGRYGVTLTIDKPVTLLAAGEGVVLDGLGGGTVVRIACPSGVVRLVGLTIVGGSAAEGGGGVLVEEGEVELSQCVLRFNKAPSYGGGALYVGEAKVTCSQCRFEGNTGRQGGAILVDTVGQLEVRDSTVIQNAAIEGGGLKVKEGSRTRLFGCTIADNKVVGEGAHGGAIAVAGTSSRAPELTLSHCILSERAEAATPILWNSDRFPGVVAVDHCLLPPWMKGHTTRGNVFGDPAYVASGAEPYQLQTSSPAIGAGDANVLEGKDVLGVLRTGKPTLGAFAAQVSSALPY